MEYLSPQGVLLPLVYGTTASPLWLELRGRSAWQATPSWTVYRLACHRLHPWLRVTFAMVSDAAWPGSDQQPWSTAPTTGPVGRLGRPSVSDPWGVGSFLSPDRPTCVRCPGPPGSCSPVCPLGVFCRVCGVLGLPAPVHRCARSVWCVVCAVSWASRLLFTGAPARCVVLCVRCLGPPGSCSPVCPLGVLCCVCGVLGLPAPVHRCARSVCCVGCAVSWASWLLFTGAPARCVVLRVRCPGPPGFCSPVCPLVVLCCVCGVLGLLAPVHRCAHSVCCVACAVSWASWLLFTGVPARCVALRVRCPGPPGSCSPVYPLGVLFCVCGVLGLPAPVHRCACSVCCVVCAVSWASRLLFTGAPARCVVLCVRCLGPPGSCSPVCPLGVLCCVCGVLGLPAPVHRCARSVCCVACAVSWASRLLFTGAPARCVVLRVRCPGPPGFCSPVCPLGVLCCVCGVLGLLAPVHRCAHSVCCVACAVSWASWLLFTGVPARCVALRVRCPGPPGSCSPVYPLGVLFCVCGVLGLPAPVHGCACSVCCVACAVSWASRLLFTGAPARCVVLRVRCPGPPGSCSPVCPLAVLCCVCGVVGLPAPVHLCARSVCCVGCAVSWVSWLLFTGVPARCVVLRVRCPGPPGSCSPVRPLGVLCCVCGVLGLPASVHRCARSVCCVGCAVSWASWLLFTGVPARCVVLRVRCPGPPGSCSPVCPLGVLCCVCGVLGLLAPVHWCARSVCCVACAASWASWLLFTGVPARCVVLRVRCPGPPGSCSPVCPLGVLCCVCGVLGLLAPVHRCARSVCCVACAVSWASRLLFYGVPARCVFFFFFLRVRCPGYPGSCSPVCPLVVLCCVCGVVGLLAPVHRCARSVCCVACAVSWASWLLFTGVLARCVVLLCGVLGLLAPVHRCARSVCCVACAVSWASWLLFTGLPARCVVLRVRRPGPPGSCSPVCPLGVLRCVCGVLGLPAPVHRCARSVCVFFFFFFACAVSWVSRLLFTGVPARCVVLRVRRRGPPGSCSPVCPLGVLCCVCGVLGLLAPVHRCARSVCCVVVRRPGPPGSCSPVCPLGVLCCVCGVLGLLALVHRCARSVCCVACAASWASWLLFTGVPARCVALRVRCPGPPGSCSPVCPLGVLCCVCGVLGLLAPVHRCARWLCCVACAASCASWLLFTGVPAWCVVLRVRRPGPPGSCSPLCPLGVLCCVCGVLGLLAPVHRCARSACCVAVRGVAAGRSHVHPDGGWRSRQGLGTLRAHTRPSGRRLFVAGRAWVPSGRALVHRDGGWRACACSLWPGRAGRPPGRVVVRLTFFFGRFVFLLCSAPSGLGLPPSLPLPLPFLVALALCFGCFSRPPAARLFVCSRLVGVSRLAVGCSLVVSPPPPPFLCLAVSGAPAWCLGGVFFFFFSPSSLVRPRFLWFPGPGALGLGAVRCLLCWPSASRLSVRLSLFRAFRLAGACSPSVAAPPHPPFLSRGFRRCRSALWCAVLCCASLGAVLRRAAARCVLRCCAVLCCVVLVGCRCLLRPALWRCPLPWGPVLCGVAFCGAPPCCVCFVVARWCVLLFAALLCAVCVPGCCAVRSLSSPLCVVLCFAVLVRLRCAVRGVRAVAGAWCCGVPWCGAGSGGPWLSAGGVFRCRCPCLAGWSVALWLVWFGVVPCFPVSCSVVLCCRVVLCCCALLSCCGAVGACFALLWAVVLCCVVLLVGCAVFCPVVVSACCGALFLLLCVPCLLRSVRCGALLCWLWCSASLCRVLWRCAVVWCCAVVLCCRFAVLLVFALPSCGPSCGASVVCAVVGASCCGVSLCVVVSPWAFCGVVVLLWCVVVSCCAARCPVVSCALCRVLRCRAALRCCAGLLCCAVVCAAGVCFSFCPLFLCVGVVVPT